MVSYRDRLDRRPPPDGSGPRVGRFYTDALRAYARAVNARADEGAVGAVPSGPGTGRADLLYAVSWLCGVETSREQGWSRGEQAGMDAAEDATRAALAELNRRYEERFGHIYLVCASGRTADELLSMLEERLHNPPEQEILVAAEEQAKITRLRLGKLLASAD